jgi:hypothetical protein
MLMAMIMPIFSFLRMLRPHKSFHGKSVRVRSRKAE